MHGKRQFILFGQLAPADSFIYLMAKKKVWHGGRNWVQSNPNLLTHTLHLCTVFWGGTSHTMAQEIWVQKECHEARMWVVTGLFSSSTERHTGHFLEQVPSLLGILGKLDRSPHISSHPWPCDLTVPLITGEFFLSPVITWDVQSEHFSDHQEEAGILAQSTPFQIWPILALHLQRGVPSQLFSCEESPDKHGLWKSEIKAPWKIKPYQIYSTP